MTLPNTRLQSEARALRRQGLSINQIRIRIGAAKSSVSVWVRNVHLSPTARRKIESRWTRGQEKAWAMRRAMTTERLGTASREAEILLSKVKLNMSHRRILCALMYWCEGSKTKNDTWLTFTNSDPALVTTFLELFRSSFPIDERKLRVKLHLHDYHNEKKQLALWSSATGVPLSQFSKIYRKPHTGL